MLRLSPFKTALVGHSHPPAGDPEYYLGLEDATHDGMRDAATAGSSPRSTLHSCGWPRFMCCGRDQQAQQHVAEVHRLLKGLTMEKWWVATTPVHPRIKLSGTASSSARGRLHCLIVERRSSPQRAFSRSVLRPRWAHRAVWSPRWRSRRRGGTSSGIPCVRASSHRSDRPRARSRFLRPCRGH